MRMRKPRMSVVLALPARALTYYYLHYITLHLGAAAFFDITPGICSFYIKKILGIAAFT